MCIKRKGHQRNCPQFHPDSVSLCSPLERNSGRYWVTITALAYEPWPEVNPEYLKVDIIEYPVSFNGKMRFKIELPAEMNKDDIEKAVLADARSEKWTGGSKPLKVVVVPGKIVNVVL